MRMRFGRALPIVLGLPCLLMAQKEVDSPKSQAAVAKLSAEQVQRTNDLIHRQFGDSFMLVENAQPPVLTGDFDGDGIEDAAFVASSKKVPHVEAATGYRMVDPYDDFFGYGNPQVTVRFNSSEPGRARYLLIVHGAGAEAWRSSTPKSKYVIVNLPFESLEVSDFVWKKKQVVAIEATETSTLSSMLFWDGKKYRWEPTGTE
jgi:hypothetical protein